MIAALAAAPSAAARHSPRSGCHHQPIAEVTFVTSWIDHTAGCRSATIVNAARIHWMLPIRA